MVVAASLITIAWLALSATLFLYASSLREPTEEILFVRINEDLEDTTTSFVQNTLNVAKYRGSRLIIISLDTPGGYVDSTVNIMSLLDESEIPVVVFVEHEAVSGGTYFLMASHIAVMKSGSQIGSCQPVDAYGGPITESKYINYLTGLMTRHAWLHSRNETAAELFITENLNLHAEEALSSDVINFIAENTRDLLSKLDSYTLIKYKEGEASRFTLVKRGEIGGYEVIESLDFENINEQEIREYYRTIEIIPIPSYLSDWSIFISIPLALLLPYIYTIFIVPLLSFTITPSIEIIIALIAIINGTIGIGYIILVLLKKEKPAQEQPETPPT
jgi:ATP-dependent protease ClpP protease subunit